MKQVRAKSGMAQVYTILLALGLILLFIFGVAMSSAVYGMAQWGDIAPGFSNSKMSCSSWSSAPKDPNDYQAIFTRAANQYKVSPAIVGAIFLSEHSNSWATGPWASSPKGASGPFQFMPATWDSNQVDGDGDGTKDIQNLTDSAFAAARLLQANISNFAGKRYTTEDENDIKLIGACYNWGCGGDHLDNIKKEIDGKDSDTPTETVNYMNNIWSNFQNLNVGCTGLGGTQVFKSLEQVEELFGRTPEEVSRFLVDTTFMGRSIRVNKVMVEPLQSVEKTVKNSGYAITSVGGYFWRTNANDSSELSAHAFGLAVDINPGTNPNGQRPSNSASRDPNACQHDIPDSVVQAFEANGFFWGAKYSTICDPMHFTYGGNWQ